MTKTSHYMTSQQLTQLRRDLKSQHHERKRIYSKFGALGDPTRFTIFDVLIKQEGFCVSDIAELLNITVAATSQHLKSLESNKLVIRKRDGRKVCYELNDRSRTVRSLMKLIYP